MPIEVEIESLFRPSSASVRQLLSDMVGGFAIPSYQRPYRWKPADIRRLFETVIIGLDRLIEDRDGVSFIGAIITVTGVSENHPTRPKDPRQIIDGQQRLSTMLLVAAAAHELLTKEIGRIRWDQSSTTDSRLTSWVQDQGGETAAQLLSCLADVRTYGDPEFKMLPKMIREVSDVWSNKESTARYISPVAHTLHQYLRSHQQGSDFKPTLPSITIFPESVGSSKEDHELLQRRFHSIRGLLRDVGAGKEGDLAETVDLKHLLSQDSYVLHSLFDGIEDSDKAELAALCIKYPHTASVVRIMLFSRFMLERLSLTQINARDESYAFELFESLNSTGEPLTSFETFIPLVVEKETSDKYPKSDSYEHISSTSKLLSERGDAVQTETSRLITSFLLADAGMKVPSKHNEQRRALGKRYQDAGDLAQRRAMTRQLADTALFYFRVWRDGALYTTPQEAIQPGLGLEAQFALGFLREINHTVTVAPLTRYFSQYRSDPTSSNLSELEKAIKAVTAFSILWRAAHGGTDGIDSSYRNLMRSGEPGIVGPIARTKGDQKDDKHTVIALPSAAELAAGLTAIAGSASTYAFTDQESWINAAKTRPVYEEAALTRVLLLLASHHAVADGQTGLTKDGTLADSTKMLIPERWRSDDRLLTIEHIAPQTPRNEDGDTPWAASLYADQNVIHRLGNLVLLPLDENSRIKNRPWAEKKVLYRAMSSPDTDSAKQAIVEGRQAGMQFSQDFENGILDRRRHLPMLEAVAAYSGIWDSQFIEARTENLLSRAYAILSTWLNPS